MDSEIFKCMCSCHTKKPPTNIKKLVVGSSAHETTLPHEKAVGEDWEKKLQNDLLFTTIGWKETEFDDVLSFLKSFIQSLLQSEKPVDVWKTREEAYQEGVLSERTRIAAIISDMLPILWNDDPQKHRDNINKTNTLKELLDVINNGEITK